jgi:hypothetical protein
MTQTGITVICDGVHDPALTDAFLDAIGRSHFGTLHRRPAEIFPYDPLGVTRWLFSLDRQEPITIIAFSAGVVGAIAAALTHHQYLERSIRAIIALDGWGVPLVAPFPTYRLSHDAFTHWTSIGYGQQNFYADPPAPHLDLWRSPDRVTGWRVQSSTCPLSALLPMPVWGDRITAAQWIRELLLSDA